MLLESYKNAELMWLTTCLGEAGDACEGFRGDLVIAHGERSALSGQRNHPLSVVKQAVVLACDGKLKLLAGNLASVEELPGFIERFQGDLAADALVIFFIDNLAANSVIESAGIPFHLLRFAGGMVWNELVEEAYLDKSDFKGQKAEEKVSTLFDALKKFRSKGDAATLDAVIASKTDAKREGWGAI